MGSRGISNEHTVVLYGDRSNSFAAYTYWYFRHYGHEAVKLMNGPREEWIAEQRETSDTPPDHPAQEFFVLRTDDSIRALRVHLDLALEGRIARLGACVDPERDGLCRRAA